MSTANFYNDEFFDLYVWDSEQEDACYYDRILEDEINYAEKKLKKSLDFFEISLKAGYYEGAQLLVKENCYCREYGNPYEIDNEDCKYQWDLCKSRAIRKYESEKNFINRKFLPVLAEFLGMKKLYCLGRFSNGEAVYQYAD